ncbi:hypothetical protein ABH931_003748 [Streptacidiphilus sp. MAP12-33]|uniref:molybdopterin-dependent oxidoreductase n=1 Tax=Streptacidiphilus sp. MAP12-33 TaxID=3156266 RepID=UPI003515A36F
MSPDTRVCDGVELTGDLERPLRLDADTLRSWPQHTTDALYTCGRTGPHRHTFTGPLLHDVLADARPRFDPARRKERARYLIGVRGADGHLAVLTWAEIDPEFAAAPVLLAVALDGVALGADGPQLVVPQDHCGTRYIRRVSSIRVDGYDRG